MRKVLLFSVLVLCNILVLGQGRSKPGKYVERYDMPFSIMTFDDGRVYKNGMFTIMVDIEDTPYVPTKLYIGFKDSNGELIEWEYFSDEIPPLVTLTKDATGVSTSGNPLTVSNCYTVYWGEQRFVFGLHKAYNGVCDYIIERLYAEDGKKVVRRANSFSCTIDKSNVLKIGRVFREAQRRGAIRIKEL